MTTFLHFKDRVVVCDNGGYCGPLHDSGCTAECDWVSLRELHSALHAVLSALLLPDVQFVGVPWP